MSLPILCKTSSSVGSFLSMKKILGFNSLFNPSPLSNGDGASGCFFFVEVVPFDLNVCKPVLLGLFFMENGDDFLEIEGDAGSFAFCTFTDARPELLGVRDLGVTDFGDSSVLITPSLIPLFNLLVNSPIFTFPTILEAVENPEGLPLGVFEIELNELNEWVAKYVN